MTMPLQDGAIAKHKSACSYRDGPEDKLMTTALASAFSHRLVIFRLTVSATAGFLAAVMHGIYAGPSAALGFFFLHASLFVTLLDMSGLPFFFVCVFVFVTSWHFWFSLLINSSRQLTR